MSNWNDDLREITKTAKENAIAETAQNEKLFAKRLVDDIERANHKLIAEILCTALREEAETAARRGETKVECYYVVYEIKRFNPTIFDFIANWTFLTTSYVFYGGLIAGGLYEMPVVYRFPSMTRWAKHRYAFNPKIYASDDKFEKLAGLIIEELTPLLDEIFPQNAVYEFEIEWRRLGIYLGVEW